MRAELMALFPDMKPSMIESMLPYCLGNISHIAKIRRTPRPLADFDHKETIMAVGHGFDWHNIPNNMLVVDPYDYDLPNPIATQGGILLDNINTGRISKKNGVALITSAVYDEDLGSQHALVQFKADLLAQTAFNTLVQRVPDLIPYLKISAGILNLNTRRFTEIKLSGNLEKRLAKEQRRILAARKN
jgi:hypothetical protein